MITQETRRRIFIDGQPVEAVTSWDDVYQSAGIMSDLSWRELCELRKRWRPRPVSTLTVDLNFIASHPGLLSQGVASEDARADLETVLPQLHPHEIAAVREALSAGTFHEWSSINCFFGIIARCRKTVYGKLGLGERLDRPLERFVMGIWPGFTPATNAVAHALDTWLAEWQEAHMLELPQRVPALAMQEEG